MDYSSWGESELIAELERRDAQSKMKLYIANYNDGDEDNYIVFAGSDKEPMRNVMALEALQNEGVVDDTDHLFIEGVYPISEAFDKDSNRYTVTLTK